MAASGNRRRQEAGASDEPHGPIASLKSAIRNLNSEIRNAVLGPIVQRSRTWPSQGQDTGSSPVGVTTKEARSHERAFLVVEQENRSEEKGEYGHKTSKARRPPPRSHLFSCGLLSPLYCSRLYARSSERASLVVEQEAAAFGGQEQ